MDWIFDNLQLIIVISGAIAYWLNQRKREREGQDADYDGDGIPEVRGPQAPQADALEEEERTRRIQEEIRRKILERRSGGAPAAPAAPTPPSAPVPVDTYADEPPEWREEGPRPVAAPAVPPPMDTAILERQRALQEQIAALEARRVAVKARAESSAFPPAPTAAAADSRRSAGLPDLVAALRQPKTLRQAVILREVLDPPVAMR